MLYQHDQHSDLLNKLFKEKKSSENIQKLFTDKYIR